MNSEVFPLSDKYLDFLEHKCSAEFLEGTTSAGKTTVAGPKFLLRIAEDKSSKPSIISGLDIGTIEKNVLNGDMGLLEVFGEVEDGGLLEYNPQGKGKIRLPHLLFNTQNGQKIIYLLGYDNKKRWKKALGGQCYGLFIDEFNIADIEFVREAFMRADYRLCTLNPDDPKKEIYTEYVNKSRPLDKYSTDAPIELLKELKEDRVSDWTWWYFTFDDNLSLTEKKKKEIIESVPKGTKIFKNKIQGLRGRSTGLVFDLRPENIITEVEAKKYKFIQFSIGCDTSYSRKSHDKLTFEFVGITDDRKLILLEEESHNNKDRLVPFAPSDVIPKLIEFAEKCKKKWGFALNIFIDSADSGTIAEALKYKRTSGCIYKFVGAWKKMKNLTRVQLTQSWLKTGDFLIVDHCKEYRNECDIYSFTEEGNLEDGNDHNIQGCQYAWIPYKRKVGNWEIIKSLIKDADTDDKEI